MNFWKQSNHVMSWFKEENFRGAKRLPSNFMSGFLEVEQTDRSSQCNSVLTFSVRVVTETEDGSTKSLVNIEYKSLNQQIERISSLQALSLSYAVNTKVCKYADPQ